jgi:phosphoribosyl 1,2-cyclic phosphodiesterase
MKIKFYGTRGSIAVPEKDFVTFGGNTSCILVKLNNGRLGILDAGTGIRRLGSELIAAGHEQFDNIFIIFSHTHWDHIQGFPFFGPAYDPRRKLTLTIPGQTGKPKDLRDIFTTQMQDEYFPVPLDKMGANIDFWQPEEPEVVSPFGIKATISKHNHPGGAYGYRIDEDGTVLVYCTDIEHGETIDPNVVELAKGADLLIHDSQYTEEEFEQKKGWGHSTYEQALEVAERAGVKRLALFHHDPEHDDVFLEEMEKKCRDRFSGAFMAREGMEIEI